MTTAPARAVCCLVRGRVQGVYFRAETCREARRLGLDGWVRNLPDGAVELWAQGVRADVARILAWAAHGPPAARVDGLEVEEETARPGLNGFNVRS